MVRSEVQRISFVLIKHPKKIDVILNNRNKRALLKYHNKNVHPSNKT